MNVRLYAASRSIMNHTHRLPSLVAGLWPFEGTRGKGSASNPRGRTALAYIPDALVKWTLSSVFLALRRGHLLVIVILTN